MQACLYSFLLKLSTTLFTPKTATPPAHSPTPHHMKFGSTKNLISLNFVHLVVRPTSTTIHPIARSCLLVLLRASSLGMQIRHHSVRISDSNTDNIMT